MNPHLPELYNVVYTWICKSFTECKVLADVCVQRDEARVVASARATEASDEVRILKEACCVYRTLWFSLSVLCVRTESLTVKNVSRTVGEEHGTSS